MEPTKEEKPTPNFIEEKMREFDERFPRVELKSFLRQALEEAREVGRDDCCVSRLGCLCTVKNCNGEGCRCPEHYVKHEEWLSELIKSREEAIAEERKRIMEGIREIRGDLNVIKTLMQVESIINKKII